MIHRLKREGLTVTAIARRLGRTRQTIYNHLRSPEDAPPRRRASKLDAFRTYLESRLETYDLPATVLLREIRARGYRGGISILRELVASIKDRHVRRLVERFETEPGRQAQVDWASCGTIQHQGRTMRLSLMVVVLGYSRVIWGRFVVSERRPVLMELLEAAFRFLGGVPKELVFDNLKAVIAEVRTEGRAARVQPGFRAFAEHWGFEVVACPPYWPRAKGKVERAILYIEKSFLEGRRFTSLEDLNAQLDQWLSEVANRRVHGTTKERPVDRLVADREAMLPLTPRAFPSQEVERRRADWDARISFRGVHYSVDPEILTGRRGQTVEVHVTADGDLEIRHEGRLVGRHRRMPPGSPPQDDPQHAAKRRKLREKPKKPKDRPKVCFEQVPAEIPESPVVAVMPLESFEEVSCRVN